MSLLGKHVRDSVSGVVGLVTSELASLYDNPRALLEWGTANGEPKEVWMYIARLSVVDKSTGEISPTIGQQAQTVVDDANKSLEKVKAAKKAKADVVDKDTPDAAVALETGKALAPGSMPAVTQTQGQPAVNSVTATVETYERVKAAFIALGKAGQGGQIQKILSKYNVFHAKDIQTDAAALADVAQQAEAAVAALAPKTP